MRKFLGLAATAAAASVGMGATNAAVASVGVLGSVSAGFKTSTAHPLVKGPELYIYNGSTSTFSDLQLKVKYFDKSVSGSPATTKTLNLTGTIAGGHHKTYTLNSASAFLTRLTSNKASSQSFRVVGHGFTKFTTGHNGTGFGPGSGHFLGWNGYNHSNHSPTLVGYLLGPTGASGGSNAGSQQNAPEPATILLMSAGLVGLGAARRRRRPSA